MSSFLRRRYVVSRIQYRLILVQASYFALLGGATFLAGIVPLLGELADPHADGARRLTSARILLFLNEHVLPYAVPLALLLFAHSVIVSHRIAGPLYRLRAVMRAMAGGDLSMRVKIRKHDWLQEEANSLDEVVSGLRGRLREIATDACELDRLLDLAPGADPTPNLRAARRIVEGMRSQLRSFKLERSPPPDAAAAAPRKTEAA